jgi:hypothetical protein
MSNNDTFGTIITAVMIILLVIGHLTILKEVGKLNDRIDKMSVVIGVPQTATKADTEINSGNTNSNNVNSGNINSRTYYRS